VIKINKKIKKTGLVMEGFDFDSVTSDQIAEMKKWLKARSRFLDVRALTFAAVICGVGSETLLLQRCAESGEPMAAGLMASSTFGVAGRRMAELAAGSLEPLGLHNLANHYELKGDRDRALSLYKIASDLDFGPSQMKHGELGFSSTDPRRFQLWASARRSGGTPAMILAAAKELAKFDRFAVHPQVVFYIGQGLFGCDLDPAFSAPATRAVRVYDASCKAAAEAIFVFALIALRYMRSRVNTDVRKMICRMIWEERWTWSEKFILEEINH
jgi:hypothetical protein